jgi:hypothetical protein
LAQFQARFLATGDSFSGAAGGGGFRPAKSSGLRLEQSCGKMAQKHLAKQPPDFFVLFALLARISED